MKVTGTVTKKLPSKFGGESIIVNGAYYNSKFSIKCNEGDTVEFDDGGKNYCQKLKVLSSTGAGATKSATPAISANKERSIVRQNALRHAAVLMAQALSGTALHDFDVDAIAEKTIELAIKFEAYSSGDNDSAVAGHAVADKDFNDE